MAAFLLSISRTNDNSYSPWPSIVVRFPQLTTSSNGSVEVVDSLQETNRWLTVQNNVPLNKTNRVAHPQANSPQRYVRMKIDPVKTHVPNRSGQVYPTDNATYTYYSSTNTHRVNYLANGLVNIMFVPLTSAWGPTNISGYFKLNIEAFGNIPRLVVKMKDNSGRESAPYMLYNVPALPGKRTNEIPFINFLNGAYSPLEAKEILIRPADPATNGSYLLVKNVSIDNRPVSMGPLMVPIAYTLKESGQLGSAAYDAITPDTDYRQKSMEEWEKFIQTFINGYKDIISDPSVQGLVFDSYVNSNVSIEAADKAYSEGVGYGLLMSVYMNDQNTFEKIINAALTSKMHTEQAHGLFCWRIGTDGQVVGSGDHGSATDGDQDIAAALILADSLVKRGIWQQSSLNYGTTAQTLLDSIWTWDIDGGLRVKPGDQWSSGTTNPSYFSPAWYRIFSQFDNNPAHNWNNVINEGYDLILNRTQGKDLGLTPDWCDNSGQPVSGRSYDLGKDAIRTYWRLGTDALWFNEPRAKEFLERTKILFVGFGGSINPLYVTPLTMSGTPADSYTDISLISMFANGATDSASEAYRQTWKNAFDIQAAALPQADAFNYFNKSLQLLGRLQMGGLFPNIYSPR